MVGAIVGISNIDDYMIQKLISFDCTNIKKNKQGNQIGRKRPEFLSVKYNGIDNIKKLLRC